MFKLQMEVLDTMSKMNFSNKQGKGKFSQFLSSKGFYVALAVCLVGASAATWLAVDKTITGIENSNSQMLESRGFMDFPQLEETDKRQPNVPKVTEPQEQYSAPSSSPSTASSSSVQSSAQSEPSEQQAAAPVLPTLSYALPTKGDITIPYSNGELVKNTTLGDWRTHDGVDIAAAKGDEIYAAADGTVVDIKNDPLWGTMVTVRHADNNETIYCGLESNLPIKIGDAIMAKQVIGKLDGVPCEVSDKSHLHYAMKKDGKWIDPLSVMAVKDQ